MNAFKRLTRRVSVRIGIIVSVAMVCLALSSISISHGQPGLLTSGIVGAAAAAPPLAENNDTAIQPFRVNIPENELVELRRRIPATRWPTKELVKDRSQGVQLATLRELARYWATEYDWRTAEARLNTLPQFTTVIDAVKIHFIRRQVQA